MFSEFGECQYLELKHKKKLVNLIDIFIKKKQPFIYIYIMLNLFLWHKFLSLQFLLGYLFFFFFLYSLPLWLRNNAFLFSEDHLSLPGELAQDVLVKVLKEMELIE